MHNREVTDQLSARGLEPLESLEEITAADAVVVRTHGISPREQELLRSRGATVRDFTWRRVKKVHEQIREKREAGCRTVIVGNPEHPEVRAHLGHAGRAGLVVSRIEDAERIPPGGRIADAALILGGKNSSNTRKLHAIAADNGPAFHVSSPDELQVDEVLQYPVVALTAGASTCDRTIRELLRRLQAAGAQIECR